MDKRILIALIVLLLGLDVFIFTRPDKPVQGEVPQEVMLPATVRIKKESIVVVVDENTTDELIDERIKEKARVLTPEELSLYNNTLLTILEYYILTELGFDDINLIREKLKERWGDISTALSIKKAAEDKHR